MALNKWRVNFEGNERVDLPDFKNMMARAFADFELLIQSYFDNEVTPRVLRRYQEGAHTVNTFKLLKDVNRAWTDKQQQWLYVNADTAGSTQNLIVTSGATNYVMVRLKTTNDDLQTRAFWDTDIGLTGQEFFDEINVRTRFDEEFLVNTTGFVVGWIPLFTVVVDGGGNITTVTRSDDAFWKHRSLSLPAANVRENVYNSTVQDLRSFIDLLGATMGEVKSSTGGTLAAMPWSNIKLLREYQNIFYTGGGNIEWEGTQGADTLGWDDDIEIVLAGRAAVYTILAGSEALLEGECLYVSIPEGGSANLTPVIDDLDNVPTDPTDVGFDPKIMVLFYRRNNIIYGTMDIPELESGQAVVIGQELSNNLKARLGILTNTTYVAYTSTLVINANDSYAVAISKLDAAVSGSSDTANQDRNMKLVRGGVWAWNSGTNSLSFSADAFIQIENLLENRNKISTASSPIVIDDDGKVAFVDVNRTAGAPATLTVSVDYIENVVPGDDRLIIARRIGGDMIVGNGTMKILNGESREIDRGLSEQTRNLIGGIINPITEATQDPQWASRGAPRRNITDGNKTLDAIASLDTELDKFFGQLKIQPHASPFKAKITGVDKTMLDASVLSQELKNLILDFDGAVINFSTGVINKADDSTPLGNNFTPFSIPVGEYFWYGVGIVEDVANANNSMKAKVTISQALSSNALQLSAPYPDLDGDKKLGAILFQNVGGTITLQLIRQLGVGSGSGSGGSLPKMQKETPSGAVNGSNVTFGLSLVPKSPQSVDFFLDGLHLEYGVDFTVSGQTATLTSAPSTSQRPYVNYVVDTSVPLERFQEFIGTGDGSTDTFSLSGIPESVEGTDVYLEGLFVEGTDWGLLKTISNAYIVFQPSNIPSLGQRIFVSYFKRV